MKPMQISKTTYKVSDFLSWQRAGSLQLSPHFQRRPVWPPEAKSYLIDTVVRGLPMPIIFLRERANLTTLEPSREVVDGQQRLRTLFAFIQPGVLSDFDEERDKFLVKENHNKELAGLPFKLFPDDAKQQLLDYEFSVHTLNAGTDDKVVLQIFARLNSTGLKVNAQEIRNAIFIGSFKALMYDLAHEQLQRWRDWGVFDDQSIARMLEVEMTSELALMMMKGLQSKSQKAIDKIYKDNEDRFAYKNETSRRFRLVMDEIDNLLGDEMEDLVFSRQALFHTLFTFLYDLLFGLGSSMKKAAADSLPKRLASKLRAASDEVEEGDLPEDLAKALRGAVAHIGTRQVRLRFLRRACGIGAKK